MALKANLQHFLNDEGTEVALTEQAKMVFEFLTTIILAVSEHTEQPLNELDLQCNTRATGLTCTGNIAAKRNSIDLIAWHCDTCAACGTISHWQGSQWDMQKRTIH